MGVAPHLTLLCPLLGLVGTIGILVGFIVETVAGTEGVTTPVDAGAGVGTLVGVSEVVGTDGVSEVVGTDGVSEVVVGVSEVVSLAGTLAGLDEVTIFDDPDDPSGSGDSVVVDVVLVVGDAVCDFDCLLAITMAAMIPPINDNAHTIIIMTITIVFIFGIT
jgi:hypothetical protein